MGIVQAGLMTITGGLYPADAIFMDEDYKDMKKLAEMPDHGAAGPAFKYNNQGTTADKLTDVYLSGTRHEEKQPCHLKITTDCARCAEEYGNPCEKFCPAGVYVVERDETTGKFQRLRVDFSNCVHCKTCDIKDPYAAIEWVCPEGGGGPLYKKL
jgi:electron-transferring-flavoprotein dehydrogenase